MSESFTAIICTGEPGGPQSIQNWHLARALAARGHRIDLVCDGRRDDLVGMCDGLRVATWPSGVPGRLTDYRFFHRLVRRRQPDAVIGNFQSVNVALPIAAALGVPTRIAWHRSLSTQTPLDYPRPRAVQWIQDRLKAFVLAQATHVVAVSPAGQRDAIAAYGVPAARCQTVFHTCRPDPLRLLAATPSPDPEWRRIAYLGRVAPSKGIDVLLLALRRLRDREPWWPLALDIVGDGAARPALAALAEDLGIGSLITWHGQLDQPRAFAVLARAHVMALPIRSDPGPGVVPEGLGLGLPLVVSRSGGIADLLTNVPGTVLFMVDDDHDLAVSLRAILADPAEQRRLATAARQSYLDHFRLEDWVSNVAAWLENTVVRRPRPGAPASPQGTSH